MQIDDQTQNMPNNGWCVVVIDKTTPMRLPLAAFVNVDQARAWVEENGGEECCYGLFAVPLSTVR